MSTLPKVVFGPLPHADGSASYSWHGFEIVGAVNGPIEAQRRDELPQEVFLEVNIRPASGTGGRSAPTSTPITVSLLNLILHGPRHSRTPPRAIDPLLLAINHPPAFPPAYAHSGDTANSCYAREWVQLCACSPVGLAPTTIATSPAYCPSVPIER